MIFELNLIAAKLAQEEAFLCQSSHSAPNIAFYYLMK